MNTSAERTTSRRGIEVLLWVGLALLCLEGMVLFVAGQVLWRRFGIAIFWTNPRVILPIGAMALSAAFALEALFRRRGDTSMVANTTSTLLVVVAVLIHFVREARAIY